MAEGPRRRRSFYEWLNEQIAIGQLLGWLISVSGFVYGGLDRRLEFREALQKALRKPVPNHINWTFCFGGMTFFLFLVQVVTGILLTLYYRPTPEGAYESVRYISSQVAFGWFIRGLHHWGANAMILMILLHVLRVFLYQAYKNPRELNWVAGMVLLFMTLAMGFTGYLLPWDQLSYWATTVGTESAGAVPIAGNLLLILLRGGPQVTGETLIRFYAAHVIILPASMLLLLGLHFVIIRRQGISGPL